jgi:hypothetical protein
VRVDVFSTIHKAIRGALFELASELARLELLKTCAVDGVIAQVEHVLGLLDEHAALEDQGVLVTLRTLDPLLADELDKDHRSLDIVQHEVERLAQALAMADLASREAAASRLQIAVNHLIALQLLHMNREETEANRVLWSSLDDAALVAIAKQAAAGLDPVRLAIWQRLIASATTPAVHVG